MRRSRPAGWIDAQGRLFGWINVVDLGFGILAVVLVWSVAAASLQARRTHPLVARDALVTFPVEFETILEEVSEPYLDRVHAGDKMMVAGGKVVAEVLSLGPIRPLTSSFSLETLGELFQATVPSARAREARLRLLTSAFRSRLYVQDQMITLNNAVQLSFSGYTAVARIVNLSINQAVEAASANRIIVACNVRLPSLKAKEIEQLTAMVKLHQSPYQPGPVRLEVQQDKTVLVTINRTICERDGTMLTCQTINIGDAMSFPIGERSIGGQVESIERVWPLD